MQAKIKKLQVEEKDLETAILSIEVNKSVLADIPSTDKPLSLEITVYKKKRSLSANAYMWVLLDKIARLVGGGTSKEQLYRKYIKESGVFDASIWIQKDKFNAYKANWESRGEGNMVEIAREKNGLYNLICYYGSHFYKTDEMSFLIETIIRDAEELGIPTITPKEFEEMMKRSK